MTYYLAIDYKAYHTPTWRFLKLLKGLYEKELNLREARNYAITMMKKDSMIWCITILKRSKGEYLGIERVMPDGITSIDDVRDGWGFIEDGEVEEHSCFTTPFHRY